MWKKQCVMNPRYKYTITSERHIVEITGGSITFKDAKSGETLKRHKGHQYLYSGDISPDEGSCFALENGKHFFVYDLGTLELVKRVTLPRGYEAIDVYGFYEDRGAYLTIPAQKWIAIRGYEEGYYERVLFRYETEGYTLVEKRLDENPDAHGWTLREPDPEEEPLPDDPEFQKVHAEVGGIMKRIFSKLEDDAVLDQIRALRPERAETDADLEAIMELIFGEDLRKK